MDIKQLVNLHKVYEERNNSLTILTFRDNRGREIDIFHLMNINSKIKYKN